MKIIVSAGKLAEVVKGCVIICPVTMETLVFVLFVFIITIFVRILAGDPRGTRDTGITQNYSFGFQSDADFHYREGRDTLAWSWHQDMFTMFTSHDDTL